MKYSNITINWTLNIPYPGWKMTLLPLNFCDQISDDVNVQFVINILPSHIKLHFCSFSCTCLHHCHNILQLVTWHMEVSGSTFFSQISARMLIWRKDTHCTFQKCTNGAAFHCLVTKCISPKILYGPAIFTLWFSADTAVHYRTMHVTVEALRFPWNLLLNSNGGVGAANELSGRVLDFGVEQPLPIRNWNTIGATRVSLKARRKQKSLSCPEYLACRYSNSLIPLSNSVEFPLVRSSFSVGETIQSTARAATGAFCLGCRKIRRQPRHQMGKCVKGSLSRRILVNFADFGRATFLTPRSHSHFKFTPTFSLEYTRSKKSKKTCSNTAIGIQHIFSREITTENAGSKRKLNNKTLITSTLGAAKNNNVPQVSLVFTFKEQQPLRWAANAVARLLKTWQQSACLRGKCQEQHYANLQWVRAIVQLPRTAKTRVKHFGTEGGASEKVLARAQLVVTLSHKRAAARNDNIIYRENTILAIEKKYILLGACTLHNCVAARVTGICAQMPSLEAALFVSGVKTVLATAARH